MNHRCFSSLNPIIYDGVITCWRRQQCWLILRHVPRELTWQMPFFCRFAVWCYLPRFVRRLFWNESSKSYGKSSWTPSREQLFCLHWVTRVWVWSIMSFSLFCYSVHLSACPQPSLLFSTCLPLISSICSALSCSLITYTLLYRKWNMASLNLNTHRLSC